MVDMLVALGAASSMTAATGVLPVTLARQATRRNAERNKAMALWIKAAPGIGKRVANKYGSLI
jgi:hypothetical protein